MSFLPVSSSNSNEANWNSINSGFMDLKNREITEIFKDDTGTRRVLLGKGADGFYGLKVSAPNEDVYTAADSDLVFNSDNNVFKVVSASTVTINVPAGHTEGTVYSENVAHGLATIPAVVAFAHLPAGAGGTYNPLPVLSISYDSVNNRYDITNIVSFYVDATNVTFEVNTGDGASVEGDWVIRYYILQETAN